MRTLIAARSQVADNGASYPRLAITKAGVPLPILRDPGHLTLAEARRSALVAALDSRIDELIAAKRSWSGEVVWIDDATERLLVPDQLRSTTDGILTLDRGSRLALGPGDVLRLFVFWHEPPGKAADLDLSCMVLDEGFSVRDHVSWTNLAALGMTHSGDVTSAPAGAAEYIDVPLEKLTAGPIAATSPPPSTGTPDRRSAASKKPPQDGRSATAPTRAHAAFDRAAVVNAFALTGERGTALPFVYDIKKRELIYLDVYLPSRAQARVENSVDIVSLLGKTIAARATLRPSVADLARRHARVRGAQLTADRSAATITFGTDPTSTYDALRPQRILNDLL